jgi:uncharacterized cupredoxin-like copper-binding protein
VIRSLILIVLLAVAAGQAEVSRAETRPPASLTADLAEWSIVPSTGVVRAGLVRITARNLGLAQHQLVLVRTSRFEQVLPLDGDHATGRPVTSPVVVRPGRSRSILARLQPGTYLLIDNLPWHYWRGTSAAFVVR